MMMMSFSFMDKAGMFSENTGWCHTNSKKCGQPRADSEENSLSVQEYIQHPTMIAEQREHDPTQLSCRTYNSTTPSWFWRTVSPRWASETTRAE